MTVIAYRVAAMAAVADGPQPVNVSEWAKTLSELAEMLNATEVSALGVLLRDRDALSEAMSGLSAYELGTVLGLVLARIAGDTNDLPGLLRDVTDMIVGLEAGKTIEREEER